MSPAECWNLTAREFEARHKVREVYMAQQMAEHRNASLQLQKPDKKLWLPADFLETKEAREYRAEKTRQQNDVAREAIRARAQFASMKAGTFDEEVLPEWARMTPEEKRRKAN